MAILMKDMIQDITQDYKKMARPIDNTFPRWATDGSNIVEPIEAQKDTGWTTGQIPPSATENWRANGAYNWIKYFDENINGFSAQENDPPDLSVVINSGILRYGQSGVVNVPQQTSTAFIAPSVNNKIVGTFVNRKTGAILNAEGAESPSPIAPAIPTGYFPVYLTELAPGQTQILNEDINEARVHFETLSPEVAKVIEDSGQITDPTDLDQLSISVGNLSASSTKVVSDGYNVLKSDSGKILVLDAINPTFQLNMISAATAGNRFSLIVKNYGVDSVATIVLNVGDTIDGKTQWILTDNLETITIRCDGINKFYVSTLYSGEGKILNKGHIHGLKTSNNVSDPDYDIDFGIGEARDLSDQINIINQSVITKKIDATWAPGTNAGGLASGVTFTAQRTYHAFIIGNELGQVDAGFDDLPTGANLLADAALLAAGFTHLRRVSSFVTEPGTTIPQYIQIGDRFIYAEDVLEVVPVGDLTAGIISDINVPSKINAFATGNVFMDHDASNVIFLRVSSVSTSNFTPTTNNKTLGVGSTPTNFQGRQSTLVETLVDHPTVGNRGQIRFRTNAPAGGTVAVSYTLTGWIDTRDRT